jgi:hypothetical protein
VIVMPNGVAISAEQNTFSQLGFDACPTTSMGTREAEVLIDCIDVMRVKRGVALAVATIDAPTAEEL